MLTRYTLTRYTWRDSNPNPGFQIPPTDQRKPLPDNDLRNGENILVAHWQRARGEDCRQSAPADSDEALRYVNDCWPNLPPHIRDAILTLIDAASKNGAAEGGHHVQ